MEVASESQLQPILFFFFGFRGPRGLARSVYILHVMDYFSRYSRASPTLDANYTNVIGYLKQLFTYFPQPTAFYCDRGHHFNNQDLRTFFDSLRIALTLSPSGASKSTGLIERGNRILEEVTAKSGYDWDLELPRTIKAMGSRVIEHLRYSPTEILFGHAPNPLPTQDFSKPTEVQVL